MTNQELNEAVARKLNPPPEGCAYVTGFEKPYSTSIEAAWEIVEKLQNDGFTLSLSWCTVGDHFEWILKIMGKEFTSEWANTAPLAICKAFLKLP